MPNKYYKAQPVRLAVAFSVATVATDPSTVTLTVQDPSGNETAYTYAAGQVTKDGTGNYHYDLTTDEAGTWHYRWVGTGTCAAASEGIIKVRDSEF